LGKLGADAIKQNIRAGTVLCAPLDQVINMPVLNSKGFNRNVYVGNILKSMKERATWQLEEFCGGDKNSDKFAYEKAMAAETLMDFDDAYTAPIYGFQDCWDYYRQTSSAHHLENIHVPALILNAKNDPFFDPKLWPTEKTCDQGGAAPVKMIMAAVGGHLGFMSHKVPMKDGRLEPGTPSWVSTEMANFFQHVVNAEGSE
jgi:predicted alpha/beta-fold hydrolase